MEITSQMLATYESWAAETHDRAVVFYNEHAADLDKAPEWFYNRPATVGGSDLGAILGMSKYRTPLDVFLEKTMQKAPEPGNFATRMGTAAEAVIYNEIPRLIDGELLGGCTSINPNKPWQVAQHDNLAIIPQIDPENPVIIECKTAVTMSGFGPGCEIYNGAITTRDSEVPEVYEIQCRYGMHVRAASGFPVSAVVLALWHKASNAIKLYIIERAPEIDAQIADAADRFVFENLIPGVAPAPMPTEVIGQFLSVTPKPKDLIEIAPENSQFFQALQDYQEIKTLEAEIKDRKEAAEQIIKATIGEHEGATVGGKTVATWSAVKPRITLDSKALKADLPEVWEKYAKPGAASRRLTVK